MNGDNNFDVFQALEQTQAFLRDLSPVLWSYKENLKKEGFTEEQAFTIVRDLQLSLLNRRN